MRPSSRWLLAFVAGFVDTATFVHLSGLFAAHVTGNFVVFAAAVARGIVAEDYVKLGTFPVFVVAVMLGVFLHGQKETGPSKKWLRLLLLEGGLMLGAGAAALGLSVSMQTIDLQLIDLGIALVLVTAMGLQNAIHRLVPGPMSTVMTGNVTAFTTGLGQWLFARLKRGSEPAAPLSLSTGLIVAFGGGCLGSALLTRQVGLASVLLVALVVGFVAWRER